MFKKVLVANRGEIACRIMRTLDRLGIASVAVYSEADADALHVRMATESVAIGAAPATESYLCGDRILAAAQATGAEAIHPGYGFLSENADFAERCEAIGIGFIGPTPLHLRQFGLKHTARQLAADHQIPLLPGTPLLETLESAKSAALALTYPVMLKSTAGGGGIGLQVCYDESELTEGFTRVQRLSQSSFNQNGVFLEKYIVTARHIEVQIFGDGKGNVVALGERDCSIQRRNQKVIEETPAPDLSPELRQQLQDSAVRLGKAVQYQSAGTVEYIYDVQTQQFYFLEVNTRLQVEHGVTEAIYQIDLVEWMVRQAAGEPLSSTPAPQGHAIQVRIYAEDPQKNFQPSSGTLHQVIFPDSIRCDRHIHPGTEVTPYYDPLLAKLIVHAPDRSGAIAQMTTALQQSRIDGIETNLSYMQQVVADVRFHQANLNTRFLQDFQATALTVDVLEGGTYTTVQDYPGRVGYWNVGVPPSGPMDHLAFRLGNRLLDNPESAAGLECTVTGCTLRFNHETVIALTGARMKATIDGVPVPFWQAIAVQTGSVLKLKSIEGNGYRTYVAVRHGFDVPVYLGSRSTFDLGKFGGHAGRILRSGDVLKLFPTQVDYRVLQKLPETFIPQYSFHWEILVLYGPHGAPDFFTKADIAMFFSTDWRVHYNSTRTGVRLIGPKPQWARSDGGEAGLHPSNIHDNAYGIGTIDFTGDMPIILGQDGPSLGGFVCPATIIQAELWKIGQLKPGDTIRFVQCSITDAVQKEREQDAAIASLSASPFGVISYLPRDSEVGTTIHSPILHQIPASANQIAATYRQSGDKYLLVEYGDLELNLHLRFRAHALMEWLNTADIDGILDLTPGIRSLQIHYDSRISQQTLLSTLIAAEQQLPPITEINIPSRIVHLPLSWDDESTQFAIQRYMQSVRPDAPWCPNNIEFIRRINGLESIEQVQEIVFNARYLVLGLGDVYLGAPVATPIDPRHRLITTKYNPARTWTPENAVGIGGAYLCVYGMEGPGGYQFVGRTVQMWNRFQQTIDFQKPWLLRFFDQIRFYPVSHAELQQQRAAFLQGRFQLKIEETVFSLNQYTDFLDSIAAETAEFKTRQQAAFNAERDRWASAGEFTARVDEPNLSMGECEVTLPPDSEGILTPVSANVWRVLVQVGDRVAAGDPLVILEAMKMEISVTAEENGAIASVFCREGQTVTAGQVLLAIQPDTPPAPV
jgi:urea carboxylase